MKLLSMARIASTLALVAVAAQGASAAPFLSGPPTYVGGRPGIVRALYCGVSNVDVVSRPVRVLILDENGGVLRDGGQVTLAPSGSTRLNINTDSGKYYQCQVDILGAPRSKFRASAFVFDYATEQQFIAVDVK